MFVYQVENFWVDGLGLGKDDDSVFIDEEFDEFETKAFLLGQLSALGVLFYGIFNLLDLINNVNRLAFMSVDL